ncbi:hypothetical protein IB277_34360 [Ensifer sp. ENS07]|uniref:hypothetical protein n=1 Tax=Ensifer sp. ENS07 TaxID=2769274 RepID=UPI001781CA16|nr:hypothetical protein [Ensifer sp. ENS07]MBD9641383.1 hypothetical protein [Ensifer sp. ENS07]
MDALGAIILVAGLSWLTRRPLAESLLRDIDKKRNLPVEQIAVRGRFLDWLAALPVWPGAALIVIGASMIFWL